MISAKIECKGHKVSQDSKSLHVSIFNRDGKRVFHSQAREKKTIEEQKETVDFYLMLCGKSSEL